MFRRWFLVLRGWFDSDCLEQNLKNQSIDWVRAVPFIVLHLGCLLLFVVGVSPIAVFMAFLLYSVRMFAITGFYHRYFSHRTFQTNRVWQFIFALLGASSAQRGPLWWASHHRQHHRHADKEHDPHSPLHQGFKWSHFGWFFAPESFKTDYALVPDLARFKELQWLNRYDTMAPIALAVCLFLLGTVLQKIHPDLHTNGLQMLVWGFFVSTTLLFHATSSINSLAHKWGSRRFNTPDQSRNNFWLALITFGEGWHNNHHYYPGSARQGFFWWQIDLTYYGLLVLSKLKIIHSLRPVRMDRGKLA